MGPALRVEDYLYLIKREVTSLKHGFNFAMIGCEIHVEIGQNCLSLQQNLNDFMLFHTLKTFEFYKVGQSSTSRLKVNY